MTRGNRVKARKGRLFFSEEKKQKTFGTFGAEFGVAVCPRPKRTKVFLLLFLQKKKSLPFEFRSPDCPGP